MKYSQITIKKTGLTLLLTAIAALVSSGNLAAAQTGASGQSNESSSTKANAQTRESVETQSREQAKEQAARERNSAERERANAEKSAAKLAEQEAQVAEAQQKVEEASMAMAEAARALAAEHSGDEADTARARAELSRAHAALREASREIARAHRDTNMVRVERISTINLGDRAVIGVLLADADERGVALAGVSPGGPAEQAGLKKGDILTAVRGVELADRGSNGARDALLETMAEVKPGEEIRVAYIRDGKSNSLMLKAEQREPSSWQSMLRLPAAPHAPAAPGAPGAPGQTMSTQIIVEHSGEPGSAPQVIVLDEAELADSLAEIEDRVERFQFMFIDEDGTRIEFDEDFDTDQHIDQRQFSRMGGQAMNEANIWFGLTQTAGLELSSLNPELGSYFKADSGVLVLNVNADNSFGLSPGDVIQKIGNTPVTTPAEFMRALRELDPGAEFELRIKRERRDKTLQARLPDSRLGQMMKLHGLAKFPESLVDPAHP